MAELFLKQGQPGRALAIYRALAAERPDDAEIQRRLADIEASQQRGVPMSFHELLQNIVDNVPGAVAGIIMGFDGIAVDTIEKSPGEVDITTLLIEYSAGVQQMRRSADTLPQPGVITEIAIVAEHLTALMRPLNQELFLGVVLRADGLSGKARYLMRIAAPQIAKELV